MPDANNDRERHPITGAWRVTIVPAEGTPTLGLATIGIDGTVVNAFPPVEPSPGAPGGVVFVSSGHGTWDATGPTSAIVTFVALGADVQGHADGTGTIRARVTVDAGGETCNGEYHATMAGPHGAIVSTEQGTLRAERIRAEAPVVC